MNYFHETNPNIKRAEENFELRRLVCRACGHDGIWCSVYTGCPLNKGHAHDMKRVCITMRGKQYKHVFVFSGIGNERHCTFCRDREET